MENIRELLSQIKLFCQFDVAVCAKLEELETAVYALQEKQKLTDAAIKSLNTRYSECLMVVKSIKQQTPGV